MSTLSMFDAGRWIVWALSSDGRKLPHDWRNPKRAIDATDETFWTSYGNARQVADDHDLGVGFALGDGWAGVDIDDCRNPVTGQLTSEAQAIVDALNSYTEVSPSGTGVKVFMRAWVPQNHKRTGLETLPVLHVHRPTPPRHTYRSDAA
jgi:primase-polymerase (primpol)-like protein